jgi:CubicO group peptidase (beta-lactamase class C family)
VIFFLAALLVSPFAQAAEPVYPGADWVTASPAKHGLDPAKIADIETYAFSPKETFRTDALLIIHGGEIVFERYARDYTPTMRHYGWSTTKSVAMTLFGIAEARGKIRREDLVSRWVPEAAGPAWNGVTFEHLLSMSSGIDWREGYEASPFDSHVVTALYRTFASFDFGLFHARQTKRIAPPGERFNYAGGDTNLMMKALRNALGGEYDAFPWDGLFTPIGMKSAVLERDGSGTFVGSSYLEATPRDFARFAYLYLREGKWNGKSVVPAEWVKLAQTPSPGMAHLRLDHSPKDSPYGHSWWLNRPMPQAQIGKPFPAFPDDMYFASGHEGQEFAIIPSWDMVVIRLGCDRFGDRIDLTKVGELLKAARR